MAQDKKQSTQQDKASQYMISGMVLLVIGIALTGTSTATHSVFARIAGMVILVVAVVILGIVIGLQRNK